ncbi:MAG: antibiotic biosynthesis monooxygenase [Candidatus Sphingomonas phytovorans]|nr:antibiotic biosynthesis monooxygenase [Sphingomonas sp.]WEJ98790.1 MAG: antibiotic biosynthesis monooxygenase [Sphingomonas sp.]
MRDDRTGQIVVIFLSRRTVADDAGYAEAAGAMDSLAATQPGYRGIESTRGPDGLGITLSFWADEAAALAWRDHPEHKVIRDTGRARWYESYEVIVCAAQRSYAWERAGEKARDRA